MTQTGRLPASPPAALAAALDRELAITQHLGLVYYIAGQLACLTPPGFEHQDLVAIGSIGLIQAVDRFQPDCGARFASFAVPRIRGAILDALGAQTGVPRRVRARAALLRQQRDRIDASLGHPASRGELESVLGREAVSFLQQAAVHLYGPLSLDLILADPSQCEQAACVSLHAEDELAARIEHEEKAAELRRAVTALSQREQEILRLVYADEQPIGAIALRLGISQGRVSQLRERAVQRLRTLLERRGAALLEDEAELAGHPRPVLELQVA